MKKIKNLTKRIFNAKRVGTLAMLLFCGVAATYAQNAAGDYTAGTNALTTVTEEIAKYVPYVVKLCYAIAGVVAVVGVLEKGYEEVKNQYIGKENYHAPHSAYYSVDHKVFQRAVDHVYRNEIAEFSYNLINPFHRKIPELERGLEYNVKHQKEDRIT